MDFLTRVAHDSAETNKAVVLKVLIKLEFRSVGFVEGGKLENLEKNPCSKDENEH